MSASADQDTVDERISVDVDVHQIPLADGDRLVLCTDGLTDMVDDLEIANALKSRVNPDDAAHTLVDLALHHGGRDNVTVIVARFKLDRSGDLHMD
jgi:protein phosphatase